ncbi:transmembrane-type terpene cyclase [Streptomyces sp. NPDC054956]
MDGIVLIDFMTNPPAMHAAREVPGWFYWPLEMFQGIAWIWAYVALIRRASIDKYVGMPLGALALNFGWELTYGFVLPTPPAQKWILVAWFGLDVIILWQAVKYGRKDFKGFTGSSRFWTATVLGLVAYAALFHILLGREFADYYGIYGAQGINVFMSAAYIGLLLRRRSTKGQSMGVALSKMLGTFAVTTMFGGQFPDRWLLLFFGSTVLLLDLTYTRMLYRQFRAEGRNPWTGRPLAGTRPAVATAGDGAVAPLVPPARAGIPVPAGAHSTRSSNV